MLVQIYDTLCYVQILYVSSHSSIFIWIDNYVDMYLPS